MPPFGGGDVFSKLAISVLILNFFQVLFKVLTSSYFYIQCYMDPQKPSEKTNAGKVCSSVGERLGLHLENDFKLGLSLSWFPIILFH